MVNDFEAYNGRRGEEERCRAAEQKAKQKTGQRANMTVAHNNRKW